MNRIYNPMQLPIKRQFPLVVMLLNLFLLFSCTEEVVRVDMKGSLVGYVELVSDKGQLIEDKQGLKVTLGDDTYKTQTTESGRFEFANIKPGTYNLAIDKEDFGTHQHFSLPIVGGDEPYVLEQRVKMYQKPQVSVKFMDVNIDHEKLSVIIEIEGMRNHVFRLYLSDGQGVSPINNKYATGMTYTGYWEEGGQIHLSTYRQNWPDDLRIAPQVYFIVTVRNKYEGNPTYNPVEAKYYYKSEFNLSQTTSVRQ